MTSYRTVSSILFVALLLLESVTCVHAGFTVSDPTGDHAGIHDITQFGVTNDGTSLVFTAVFANTITDPSVTGGDPHDLFGFLDIDADQNLATGVSNAALISSRGVGTLPGLGVDYFVDLGSVIFNGTGLADLVQPGSLDPPQQVSLSFSADGITVTIPLTAVGLDASSEVQAGLIAVDGGPPAVVSDRVSSVSNAIPEPGSGTILTGLLLCGMAGMIWRRRSNHQLRRL